MGEYTTLVLDQISAFTPIVLSVLAAVLTFWFAAYEGIFRNKESEKAREFLITLSKKSHQFGDASKTFDNFEVEQLAAYYSSTLANAKISFWFSLIFASIGFIVIVSAPFMYASSSIGSAAIQIFAGLIVDSVSALFFIQSKRAQESMAAFFDKLRSDRQYVEARKICEEISDISIRDNLRSILVIHYSGLDSSSLVADMAGRRGSAVSTSLP